jgi:hypothetical protein
LYNTYFTKAKDLDPRVTLDLWNDIVMPLKDVWQSSVLAALPEDLTDVAEIDEVGLIEMKKSKMRRSEEWLQEHAVCVDNFSFGVSSMSNAGHGVFASRSLKQGSVILPVPVIHIPHKSALDMYQPKQPDEKPQRKQLLLNYCLGHRDSSLLLSPYGPVFNYINHNQTLANVRLQWALPERSNHHPDLLGEKVADLYDVKGSELALEVITLRDIEPGEEILLDYGDEWENAWQEHVKNFTPHNDTDFISARAFDDEEVVLRTEFEQAKTPYPSNMALVFKAGFGDTLSFRDTEEKGGSKKFKFEQGATRKSTCEILRRSKVGYKYRYAAVLREHEKIVLIEDLPREAFEFQDRPYTEDFFLLNAFRHSIQIPDDIFPEAWNNSV